MMKEKLIVVAAPLLSPVIAVPVTGGSLSKLYKLGGNLSSIVPPWGIGLDVTKIQLYSTSTWLASKWLGKMLMLESEPVLKALNVSFKKEETYNPEFIAKIDKGKKEAAKGNYITVDPSKSIWDSIL